MGVLCANAWVTQCLQPETDLEKVLILGKSLRDVMTRATITVIVGGNICSKDRIALEMVFDLVVEDGRCEKFNGFLTSDEIGKLFAFSLRFYKKIIYVKTNCFFIRNCDYLFDKYLTSGTSATDNGHFPSIFKPSSSLFASLLTTLEDFMASDNKTERFENLTGFLAAKNAADYFKVLNDPCFISLNRDDVKIHENMSQWGIIHLNDIRMDMAEGLFDEDSLPTADVVAKEMYKRWMNIYKSMKKGSLTLPQENRLNEAEKIAVVGMSCRFPKSNNLNEFWKLLIEGNDGTGAPPVGRWTAEKSPHYFPESQKVNAGFLSAADDEFDSKFFGISPKEVQFMDPQLRIVMEVVWESLEHAGINPHSLSGTNGSVFMGTWKNDYKQIVQNVSSDILRTHLGSTSGPMVARIAHFLGLKGPCIGTESDCSAGMAAVHMACNSLRLGKSNMAFACGANLLLKPFDHNFLPHHISADGLCKSFDESADGFGRADGCAVLILKRYSDAVRDGDRIWGLIGGTAITQEGLSHSIGTPTIPCEAEAMTIALREANVAASEVSYVEAHGTGTPLGDAVEIEAIQNAYGNCGRQEKLIIGSVKTNIGHTEACSGIAGIIKVILSMFHDQIPAHRNVKKLKHKMILDSIPAMIPLEAVPWKKYPGKRRIAGISAFGVAGADAHLILEEPDNSFQQGQQNIILTYERPLHILQISAKTDIALTDYLESFKTTLAAFGNPRGIENFANFAYTANSGKASLLYKAIIIGKDISSALDNLTSKKFLKSSTTISQNGGNTLPICFLFTGQGSQYHGMGCQLYETSPLFRMHFDYCDHFLRNNYNFSLADVYFGSESPAENVHRTIYSQTGIFVVEYCLSKLWESWGVKPSVVVGHSLGEFGAAVAAGILDIQDALKLVVERSSLIDNLPLGKMLVIQADAEKVAELQKAFGAKLDYAAFNSSEQTVVAGDTEEIMEFADFLKNNQSVKCLILKSSHAFHSKHMDPMLEAYRQVAEAISYKAPSQNCQFISGMLGKAISEINAEYWVRHTRDPVNFLEASKVAVEVLHCNLFLEVGPHPILSTFILLNNPQKMGDLLCLPSLRQKVEDWETILNALGRLIVDGGISIDWPAFDRFYPRTNIGHLLPSYPFQRTKHWITPDITPKPSRIISPLLGSLIPNPTDSTIFQNILNLKSFPYLKDHLFNFTLFPGAAYLEMLLSACFFQSSGLPSKFSFPTKPISLKHFKIFAPFALTGNDPGTTVQVVVNSSESISANIYHHEETQNNWIQHASGTFSPSNFENLPFQKDQQSILQTFSNLKTENQLTSNLIPVFYRNMAKVDCQFGRSFQLLSNAWKSDNLLLFEASLNPISSPSSSESSYLLHPTLIDAMFQASIFSSSLISNEIKIPKLQVPIGCKQFIWFNELPSKSGANCYIYVNSTDLEPSSILFDQNGTIIAALLGIDMVSTNLGTIQAYCDSQLKTFPDIHTTKWLQTTTFTPGTLLPLESDGVNLIRSEFHLPQSPSDDLSLLEQDRLVFLLILKAFQNLNWFPKLQEQITLETISNQLGIAPNHKKFLRLIFTYFTEEGILQPTAHITNNPDKWLISQLPLSAETVISELTTLLKLPSAQNYKLLDKIGQHLPAILQGTQSVLPILFPDQDKSISVETFYNGIFANLRNHLNFVITKQLETILSQKSKNNAVLKLLEVGGGTGSFTEAILEILSSSGISYEYVFTDISSNFFSSAQQKFKKHATSIKYQKLDIESDPTSQGFPPNYFDIILAAHVIHATKDIRQSLGNIRRLLKNRGNLILTETTEIYRVSDFVFGSLEGYWQFTDKHLRADYPMISSKLWKSCLEQVGFQDTECIEENKLGVIVSRADSKEYNKLQVETASNSFSNWLIFSPENQDACHFLELIKKQFEILGRKQVVSISTEKSQNFEDLFASFISPGGKVLEGIVFIAAGNLETNQDDIAQPFFNLLQNLIKLYSQNVKPKCILLTDNQLPVEAEDNSISICDNPSASTLIGMGKTVLNERKDVNLKMIDVNSSDLIPELVLQEILEWRKEDPIYLCALRGNSKFVPKFVEETVSQKDLAIPALNGRFKLITEGNSLEDLKFGALEIYSLEGNEIEVEIKSHSLKPPNFEDIQAVGSNFSGVVCQVGKAVKLWKVGDSVFGINQEEKLLGSHLKVLEEEVAQVPPSMTFAEATLFPETFFTAYHSLVEMAKVKKGETVLIHTASSDVGLIGIQIAKHLELNVICTDQDNRKRAYLKSLGIQHIFKSGSTQFSEEILKVTNGKGVDVVLNMSTTPRYKEASLAACSKGARFVEISKMDIWTESEVKALRPDVNYLTFDINSFKKEGQNLWLINKLRILNDWLESGHLKPIPYTVLEASHIQKAFGLLQEAKNIGKVIISMPEVSRGKVSQSKLFNDQSTYLITGGLGEIGIEVCKYMASQGARHFVLIGRSPPTPKAKDILQNLKINMNCSIHITPGDIGNFSKLQQIIKSIESDDKLPPLRGVMHIAGTYSDGMLENISWKNFQTTFNPKINGSWNLHQLTKHLILEHFVLFSSTISQLGSAGRCSHCSACSFQDSFAHFRNSHGYPTLNINWGQWAEVGNGTDADYSYGKPFTTQQALNTLDYILRSNRPNLIVGGFKQYFVPHQKYLNWYLRSALHSSTDSSSSNPNISLQKQSNSETLSFWKTYKTSKQSADKLQTIKSSIIPIIKRILRLDILETINELESFMSMGMDSLMLLEAHNILQTFFGKSVKLPSSILRDHSTLKQLSFKLFQIFQDEMKPLPKCKILAAK